MSASLSPRPEATVLPSLPPSPSLLEEVFSHPRPWSIRHEEFGSQGSRRSFSPGSPGSHTKGKGKQMEILEGEDDEDDDEDTQHRVSTHEAYPPITDEAAETRRVEETLKRWELAERQRRKSVRESAQYDTSGPSLLSSVTRTASLVLSGRTTSIGASVGPSSTRAFKSPESVDLARGGYAVPLDDIDHTRLSGDVVVHSPSPSIFDRSTSPGAGTGTASGSSGTPENPFVHPSERTRPRASTLTPETPTPTLPLSTPPSPSPFADAHAQEALQATPTMRLSAPRNMHTRKRSSKSEIPFVPPPRPLDLPPSLGDIPQVTPLQPTPQPVLRPPLPRREGQKEREEVRWWHDWLCGCSEGPDRGGDNQAGRTNPFE